MPNIKSAMKRLRQNRKRREINRQRKTQLRTNIKKFRLKISEGDIDGARALLAKTYSHIDKACQAGSIHPNTAARTKSRLTRAIQRAVS